jgi:hypothetical protein
LSDLRISKIEIKAYFHKIYLNGHHLFFDCIDTHNIKQDEEINQEIDFHNKNIEYITKFTNEYNSKEKKNKTGDRYDSLDTLYELDQSAPKDHIDQNKLNFEDRQKYTVVNCTSFLKSKNLLQFSNSELRDLTFQNEKNVSNITSDTNGKDHFLFAYNLKNGELYFWDIPGFQNRFTRKFKMHLKSFENPYHLCGSFDIHGNIFGYLFDFDNNVLLTEPFPEEKNDANKLDISTEIWRESNLEVEFMYKGEISHLQQVLLIFDSETILNNKIENDLLLDQQSGHLFLPDVKLSEDNEYGISVVNQGENQLAMLNMEQSGSLMTKLNSDLSVKEMYLTNDLNLFNLKNEELKTNPDWKILLKRGFLLAFVKRLDIPVIHNSDHLLNISDPLVSLLDKLHSKLKIPIVISTSRSEIFYSTLYNLHFIKYLHKIIVLNAEENPSVEQWVGDLRDLELNITDTDIFFLSEAENPKSYIWRQRLGELREMNKRGLFFLAEISRKDYKKQNLLKYSFLMEY